MDHTIKSCPYCGAAVIHSGVCPKVKSIEYFCDGSVKRVEFHDPNQTIVYRGELTKKAVIREQPQPIIFTTPPPQPPPFPPLPNMPMQPWATTSSVPYISDKAARKLCNLGLPMPGASMMETW